MTIEALIEKLTVAIEANTAAILASGGNATPAVKTDATGEADQPEKTTRKPREKAAEKAAPKITQDEVTAAVVKVKDKFGLDEAKRLLDDIGGYKKISEVKDSDFDKAVKLAAARFEELSNPADPEDDGI